MAQDQTDRPDRRAFLQAGALATASALSVTPGYGAQDAPAKATRHSPSVSWARPASKSPCSKWAPGPCASKASSNA